MRRLDGSLSRLCSMRCRRCPGIIGPRARGCVCTRTTGRVRTVERPKQGLRGAGATRRGRSRVDVAYIPSRISTSRFCSMRSDCCPRVFWPRARGCVCTRPTGRVRTVERPKQGLRRAGATRRGRSRVDVACIPSRISTSRFCSMRSDCCPRVFWPRMPRISSLQFLAYLGIGALPEAAQVLGHLDRATGW